MRHLCIIFYIMGNPCPQVYIPMNEYSSICLIFIEVLPNFYQQNYVPTRKILDTHEH